MIINSTYKEKLNEHVVGLSWNIKSNNILLAINDNEELRLEKRNSKNWSLSEKLSIPLIEHIQAVETDDDFNKILIVSKNQAVIFSWQDNEIKYNIKREEGFLSGGFMDNSNVYLTIPASSGCVDWSIWELGKGDFNEYELERFDAYGRGAVLHPSKQLIGSCWNEHESGFLIHLAQPKNNKLLFFDFDEEACMRKEYESFAPSFNLRGNKIAFVVNPYVDNRMNIEKLCIYDIFSQENSLFELDLEHYLQETVKGTYFFGNDQYVLLETNRGVNIVSIAEAKKYRVVNLPVNHLSVNPLSNQFAIIRGNDLQIFSAGELSDTECSNELESCEKVAKTFIENYSDLLCIAGDDDEILNFSKKN